MYDTDSIDLSSFDRSSDRFINSSKRRKNIVLEMGADFILET